MGNVNRQFFMFYLDFFVNDSTYFETFDKIVPWTYSPELVVKTDDLLLSLPLEGNTSGVYGELALLLSLLFLERLVEALLCIIAFTLAE